MGYGNLLGMGVQIQFEVPQGFKILFDGPLMLSLEYKLMVARIIARLGKVLIGEDPNNHKKWDPMFCVTMDLV